MCDTAETEFAEAAILIDMRREHPLKRDGSGFSRAEFQLVGARAPSTGGATNL